MLTDIQMHYIRGNSLLAFLTGDLKEEDIGHIQELKVSDGVYAGELMNTKHYFDTQGIEVFDKYKQKLDISQEEYLSNINLHHNKMYGLSEDMPYFEDYGVCDNHQQILDLYPELVTNHHKYFIFLTPILKSEQPSDGGWRWHKWGTYIGTHDSQCEYLYDEEGIEQVYCYHIYKIAE